LFKQDWYSVAKITSEEVALEYGREIGLDVVTINPALVLGPLLQPVCNTSCQFLIYFLKGSGRRHRIRRNESRSSVYLCHQLQLISECSESLGRRA
jgi:nucleoside-diphosphate-sugar epimerase